MCENIDDLFVQALKENVLPAIGCAEPVAVAYAAATAAGIISGDCKAGLKVIAGIREDELSAILDLARSGKITVSVAPVDDDLYVELRIVEAKDDAIVTIAGDHTNIFRIEENGIRLKDEPDPLPMSSHLLRGHCRSTRCRKFGISPSMSPSNTSLSWKRPGP